MERCGSGALHFRFQVYTLQMNIPGYVNYVLIRVNVIHQCPFNGGLLLVVHQLHYNIYVNVHSIGYTQHAFIFSIFFVFV